METWEAVIEHILWKRTQFRSTPGHYSWKPAEATDDTWKFWSQFVFQDAMAFVMFFFAMRSMYGQH
jgi:hypothetical protein